MSVIGTGRRAGGEGGAGGEEGQEGGWGDVMCWQNEEVSKETVREWGDYLPYTWS